MIRVLLLSTDLQRGGLPLRLVRIAPRLREFGVLPIVGCLAPRGPLSDTLERDGIVTFSCDAVGAWDVGALVRLARNIRRLAPDVIHSWLFHANMATRLLRPWTMDRPLITSTVTIEIERPWHNWLESLTVGLSDLHVANSGAVARHLTECLGVAADRIVVLPNAVDLAAIQQVAPVDREAEGIPRGARLVVWAGRMDPVKDLDTWLDVVARASRRVPLHAVLLGDGPEFDRVHGVVARRGLGAHVLLAGWRTDVAGWLKSADALLFTSRTEGSPNVVLEAIACGCPVVGSDVGGCSELIVDSGCGRGVRAGDIQSFERALVEVLARGRAGIDSVRVRDFLQSHDISGVARRWAQLYQRYC